jgi:hypothetical protein
MNGEMRNMYTVLVGKSKGSRSLKDLGVDRRIALNES